MSEMTRAVIQMPYDMAMDGEISRQQFYNRAQTLLADFDTLAQRLQEAESALQLFVDLGVTPGGWVELDEALSCASKLLAGKGGKA